MKVKQTFMFLILGYILFQIAQVFLYKSSTPVFTWWTPFIHIDRLISCQKNQECLVTADRNTKLHQIEAYLFYGSSFDVGDLPLPKDRTWALFHEESPKNLPMLFDERVQQTFDLSSTFSRNSDFPIPLQYLKSLDLLTNKDYYIDVKQKNELLKELAPVLFLQTDCDTPIERDKYVGELMKYVQVDSYGACLNNRKLPEVLKINQTIDIYGEAVMEFVGRYKFVIAIENAKCYDYITEKIWRPLMVGSVPIYMGTPTVKDWLPNEKSAILIEDFPSPKSLAEYINRTNSEDALYLSHLEHKTEGKITNKLLGDYFSRGYYGVLSNQEDVVTAFECFVCEQMHAKSFGVGGHNKKSYYECDKPMEPNPWASFWSWGEEKAKEFIDKVQYNIS